MINFEALRSLSNTISGKMFLPKKIMEWGKHSRVITGPVFLVKSVFLFGEKCAILKSLGSGISIATMRARYRAQGQLV